MCRTVKNLFLRLKLSMMLCKEQPVQDFHQLYLMGTAQIAWNQGQTMNLIPLLKQIKQRFVLLAYSNTVLNILLVRLKVN